jgi:hypothetical protein
MYINVYAPDVNFYIYVPVSLPRERFQEIRRMMTVQTTHGLSIFIFT